MAKAILTLLDLYVYIMCSLMYSFGGRQKLVKVCKILIMSLLICPSGRGVGVIHMCGV